MDNNIIKKMETLEDYEKANNQFMKSFNSFIENLLERYNHINWFPYNSNFNMNKFFNKHLEINILDYMTLDLTKQSISNLLSSEEFEKDPCLFNHLSAYYISSTDFISDKINKYPLLLKDEFNKWSEQVIGYMRNNHKGAVRGITTDNEISHEIITIEYDDLCINVTREVNYPNKARLEILLGEDDKFKTLICIDMELIEE